MKEKEISINNLKVNYKMAGEGEPLLILHGWGGSSGSWIEVQKILAKEGFKIIVPDLPGFGKTLTPSSVWGVDEYVDFVSNLIDKMAFQRVTILGHSFGGRLGIRFATSHPNRLEKLILCASAGIKHEFSFSQKIIWYLSVIGNFIFSKRPFNKLRDVARNIFYIFLRRKDYAKARGVMKEIIKKVLDEDLKPELSQIQAKTLLIWGEKDKSVPIEDAYLMKENIPQSRLEIIPRASHTPNLEFPHKLARIISNFLKE
jgi:pimeloyl-ACP methyl ester carboxylesterase